MQSMTLILYRAFFEKKAVGVGLSSQRSSNGVEIGTLRFLWDGSEVVVTALGVISQVNGDASHGQSFPHKFMAVVVVLNGESSGIVGPAALVPYSSIISISDEESKQMSHRSVSPSIFLRCNKLTMDLLEGGTKVSDVNCFETNKNDGDV